jgi:cobalt/nickel transport system ATP-binding protein
VGQWLSKEAVKVNHVSYRYPDGSSALDDVSLWIKKGERVAFIGPNGAGKSTLLMLISGLLVPSSGYITILGDDVNKKNLSKIRRNIGLVFQEPDDQLFCPTLWDDVIFGPMNMNIPQKEVIRRGQEALQTVGLEAYREKAPHHLSVGEKKKAAIAVILAMTPTILILDEPTADLDPISRLELLNLINRLHKNKENTIIIATHDVNIVPYIADRVIVLNNGKKTIEGSPREIFSNIKILKQAKLEPPIVTSLVKLLSEKEGKSIKKIPLTIEEALHTINLKTEK